MKPFDPRSALVAATLLGLVAFVSPCAAQGSDAIEVSLQDVMARPGDRVLVPVVVNAIAGREIIAGEIGVRFDPGVLTWSRVVRRGSLLENQRWLTASDVVDAAGGLQDFRLVYAAARGFTEDGDLVFLDFRVSEQAVIGTTTSLEVVGASFNNGSPGATLSSGTVRIVAEVIEAAFVARPTEGEVPLGVRFVDRSAGTVDSYSWDFGDGSISAEKDPQHDYLLPGTYTVSLTVTGPSGSDTETRDDYIGALPDETPPRIIKGPRAVDVQQHEATIVWDTNERADSFVEFSLNPDFAASETVLLTDLVIEHEVALTGLQIGARYFYRVRATDAAGNASRTRKGSFRTRSRPDRKAPIVVKGPAAEEITDVAGKLVWSTSEFSTSVVEYATDEDFGDAIRVELVELVEEHSVDTQGLEPNTRYFYRVQSVDAAGNVSHFRGGHFQTRDRPDLDPAVVLLGPVAISRTHEAATIKWNANKPVSALVNYGTGTDYGLSESRDSRQKPNLVRLTNLEPNTEYHVQVVSTAANGLQTVSEDFVFITRSLPDVRLPRIVLRPHLIGRFLDRLLVKFETDEPCIAAVEYGPDTDYGSVAFSEAEERVHTVVLSDLDPDAGYHFRVNVTDVSGNGPVLSSDQEGTTLAAAVSTPLRILQGPTVSSRDSDRVTIGWKTNRASDAYIEFGLDTNHGRRDGDADLTTDHAVTLSGLDPGTLYHYRVLSTDPEENAVAGDDFTFVTRAARDVLPPFVTQRPEVLGVTEASAFIAWTTNEPTDALIDFGPDLNYGETLFREDFEAGHKIDLTGLLPGLTYHFRVSSDDAVGNGPARSGDITFQTLAARDEEAPAILAGPGTVDLGSDVVTIGWRTNEPADSFVDFGETEAFGHSAGRAALTRKHSVTLSDLSPNTAYHYRVSSSDLAENTATTDDSGNKPWSRELTFRTSTGSDTKPPVITRGPSLVVGNRGVLLNFRTDELCLTELAYGTASTMGTPAEEVVFEDEPTGRHGIRIGQLLPRTRYIFRLTCRDGAGNELVVGPPRRVAAKVVLAAGSESFSGALEFTTEESDDTYSPVIVSGPTLASRTGDSAILEWSTDEPADSYVDFGTSDLSQTIGDAQYTQDHRIFLTGLTPSTTYSYQVRSTDFAGNTPASSQTLGFTTMAGPDLTPPLLLSGPDVVFVDDHQAILHWSTDEAASPLVEYGVDDALGLLFFDDVFATEHSVQLTALEPSTTYSFRISSADPSHNGPTASDVLTFTTASALDFTPPRVSAIGMEDVSDVQAIAVWMTDEPSNRFVFYGAGDSLDRSIGATSFDAQHRLMLTNLQPSTTYRFQVESVDPAGNSSGRSALSSFTTSAGPDAEAPLALTGFEAAVGLETAVLSWTPSAAADLASYTLYRRMNTGPFAPIATGLADAFYLDAGLFFGSTYNYYVTASDLTGNESSPSQEEGAAASVRNVPGALVPMSTETVGDVVVLTVSNAIPGSKEGPLTYTFHVSTTELFDDIVARGAGIGEEDRSTSWSFEKELEPGREYFWRARASDSVFDGPWSFPAFFAAVDGGAPGDFNGNGAVDLGDFFLFADAFGSTSADPDFDEAFDLSVNSRIDLGDFFLFADVFGTVYSSSRIGATDGESEWPGTATATSRMDGEGVVVDIELRDMADVRGVAVVLAYDPAAVQLLSASGSAAGLLSDLAHDEQLWTRVETGKGEMALFAHRLQAAPFSGDGTIGQLRFRPLDSRQHTWVAVTALSIQTPGGVLSSPAPQQLRIRLVPQQFSLAQNFPNPFNPQTAISYDLPSATKLSLTVYDVLGREVVTLASGEHSPGHFRVAWDGLDTSGRQVASGLYFYRLESSAFSAVHKMLLLR